MDKKEGLENLKASIEKLLEIAQECLETLSDTLDIGKVEKTSKNKTVKKKAAAKKAPSRKKAPAKKKAAAKKAPTKKKTPVKKKSKSKPPML